MKMTKSKLSKMSSDRGSRLINSEIYSSKSKLSRESRSRSKGRKNLNDSTVDQ